METLSHGPEASLPSRSRRPDSEKPKAPERLERRDVSLDLEHLKVGDRIEGSTGTYEVVFLSSLFKTDDRSLLECRVKDAEGREFFMHNKEAETQALAGAVGESVVSSSNTGKITYPEMRLETINGSDVLLMEYFDGYRESEEQKEQGLTPEQKAHLVVTNLWMANVDFRPEHVLVDDKSGKIGLIDLERAFRFSDPKRLPEAAFKMPFLDDGIPEAAYDYELAKLSQLDEDDRDKIIAHAVGRGVEPEYAKKVVDALFARRDSVAAELRSVLEMRAADKDTN